MQIKRALELTVLASLAAVGTAHAAGGASPMAGLFTIAETWL